CAQVAQRARSPSRGAEGTGEELDAGSLEDGSQGGHEPHPQAGRVAGTRVSFGCIQPAGGAGGMLHHQPAGCAALIATLPGDDQHHREPACRSAHPNPPHHKLAKWLDGEALDGLGFPENGEELPQDHGLSRTLDAGGDSERIAVRHSTGCGVVTSTQPPLGTFNYARDILFPAVIPFKTPSAPSTHSSNSASAGRIVMITSDCAVTSAPVVTTLAPSAASSFAGPRLR